MPPDPEAYTVLTSWLKVAESQICSLEILCRQLNEVNERLQGDVEEIIGSFVAMAANIKEYRQSVDNIIELADSLKGDKEDREYQSAVIRTEKLSKEISTTLSRGIVGMQFQDWVSQNIVIAVNVLSANIRYLEKQIETTFSTLEEECAPVALDKDFTKNLIAQFALGKLQQDFVEHLLDRGYIKEPGEIGYALGVSLADESANNLTLF